MARGRAVARRPQDVAPQPDPRQAGPRRTASTAAPRTPSSDTVARLTGASRTAGTMDRNAFRLWLKPDPEGIETYAQWHLHPFPELYDLIRAAGIRRYTIWLDGVDLLLTREA